MRTSVALSATRARLVLIALLARAAPLPFSLFLRLSVLAFLASGSPFRRVTSRQLLPDSR